jgi:hypothetical protein
MKNVYDIGGMPICTLITKNSYSNLKDYKNFQLKVKADCLE